MKNKIQKAERESLDIKDKILSALKISIPEVISEGKVNWDKLRHVLGEQIEATAEKFNFTWAGKSGAVNNVLIPSKATLCPEKKESIKFDESENLFIEGDNLEVLKLLQKSYFEKVKMIYIDPPYNTGNDFVYKDDFRQPLKNYLEQSGQMDGDGNRLSTNTQASGRFHSDWLNMMYPRLKLAWNLLRHDGVIFISIDDNEAHHLRMMMNEIFGEENFVAQIVVQTNPRGRTLDRYLAKTFEYILVFTKDYNSEALFELAKNEKQLSEYKKLDDNGEFRLLELRNRNPVFNRKNRPNLFFPIYVSPDTGAVALKKDEKYSVEALPINSTQEEGCWTWGKDKVQENIATLIAKKVNTGVWRIYRKDYIPEEGATTKAKTLWIESGMNHEYGKEELGKIFDKTPFDFPKSVELIKKCILLATKSNNNHIILDFFAGSGTTANAVLTQNQEDSGNRKFIMVQIPEPTAPESEAYKAGYKTIADIGKERIRRVIKGYGDHKPINDGFKVFKLDKSNYADNLFEYDPAKSDEENEKALKAYLDKAQKELFPAKINELDIVYENIVKEGLNLNALVKEIKIGKNKAYKVADSDRELFICLDEKISDGAIDLLTAKEFKEKIFICFDGALSDSDKANIALNLTLKTI